MGWRKDPLCTIHDKRYPRGGHCVDCLVGTTPGQHARRAQPTRPGQSPTTGHAPYPCPSPGCTGTVRGGFCPLSDLHR